MKAQKAGSTLPTTQRFVLNKADMFRVGRLIEAAIEKVPGGQAYKLGCSDTTIAAEALEKHDLALTTEAVAKLRKSMFDPLVTDKGGTKGKVEALQLEVSALRKQVIEQGKLIATMQATQRELMDNLVDDRQQAPRQPRPNGRHA
jgi:hypothetical protein